MIKSKDYNNVSDKIVPTLKRDEVAHFQYNNITTDDKGNPIYPTYIIPSQDKIWDDGKKDYVDIAYIVRPSGKNDDPVFGEVTFDRQQKCMITCRGDNPRDVLLYQYLKLSNYNEDNPHRDTTKQAIYKEITPSVAGIKELQKAKQEKALNDLAIDGKIETLTTLLMQRGVDTTGWTEDRIRSKVLEEGKKKPFEIEEKVENVDSFDYERRLREAEEADLIRYDGKKGVYILTEDGRTFAKVFRSVKDKIGKLAEIVRDDPELKEKVKQMF